MQEFIDDLKLITEMGMKAKKMMIDYTSEMVIKCFEQALDFVSNS